MRFISAKERTEYRIVGFAAIDNSEKKISINPGWEMKAPYIVG